MKFYKECSKDEAVNTFYDFINYLPSLYDDTTDYDIENIIELNGKYDVHIHNDNLDYTLFIPKVICMCRYLNEICVFLYFTDNKFCYYIDDFKKCGGLRSIQIEY